MALLLFIIIHWYLSLFFQSVFHHRYAAHALFSMSRRWEKVFYIGSFITQGSSYISPRTYGLMHRLHHAHTDTPEDPHSPQNTSNFFRMMLQTRNNYYKLYTGETIADDKYYKNLPDWAIFDKLTHNWVARIIWFSIYTAIYCYLATSWWQFIFLPFTCALGSVQGAAVNWWAHRFGYENFSMNNTSRNILRFDLIFWGEAYHNNHHKHPSNPNNAQKRYEWDMGYQAMRLLHTLKVIRIKKEIPAREH